MTGYRAAPTVDPHQLTQLRADIDQLTNPIPVPIRQRLPRPGGRRTVWTVHDQPSLLDQLRDAAQQPGPAARGPQGRQIPSSRPPANLDALDALAAVYVALAGWHAAVRLPSPPPGADWQKTALAQLAADSRHRTPDLVAALAADVHHWWRAAATHSGWSQTELQELQRDV